MVFDLYQYEGGGLTNVTPRSLQLGDDSFPWVNQEGNNMNKAFKVLWNEVRELAVVSSEAQKSHGKPKKAIATAVLAGLLAVAGTAGAN